MDHAINTLFACGMTTAAFGIVPLARSLIQAAREPRVRAPRMHQETLEQQEREAEALMRAHP